MLVSVRINRSGWYMHMLDKYDFSRSCDTTGPVCLLAMASIPPSSTHGTSLYEKLGVSTAQTSPFRFSSHLWLKNQLLLFPGDTELLVCSPEMTGMAAWDMPLMSPPPPRNGLAMREPAPPKLNAPFWAEPERPRVEPSLAASSRSLTAVSCASNLGRSS